MLVVNVKDGTRYFGGAHFVQGWLAQVKIVSSPISFWRLVVARCAKSGTPNLQIVSQAHGIRLQQRPLPTKMQV